jgi:hypothetical protein
MNSEMKYGAWALYAHVLAIVDEAETLTLGVRSKENPGRQGKESLASSSLTWETAVYMHSPPKQAAAVQYIGLGWIHAISSMSCQHTEKKHKTKKIPAGCL